VNYYKAKLRYISILLGLLILLDFAYPQSYQVHTYTEDDGLPSSTVYDITQDNSGRMWFATRSGVAVYDGFQWRSFTVADGLPAIDYFKIKVDKQGTIWALPRAEGSSVLYLWQRMEFASDAGASN
jgi:ligand-binding sensor domain-containing protein